VLGAHRLRDLAQRKVSRRRDLDIATFTAAIRLRLLVAEDAPAIKGYDQDRFASRLYYQRPHEASLELFRAARASTVELMGCLTEADWLREGTHTEVGRFGVDTWLRIYAPHAHRHADQIRVARSAAVKK
jgi:hypothetical protein